MARIVKVSARLVNIPVETERTDAIQAFLVQETPFVEIETDDGRIGRGYSYTIGTGGSAVLALLHDVFLPRLIGEDARAVEALWHRLWSATRATTPGTLTALALAAVDTALWDLRCQRNDEPLWLAAGGFRQQLPAYDTEHGWLHLSEAELVEGMRALADSGWTAAKMKVGRESLPEDVRRVARVREAVGEDFTLFVDANQGFTRSEAQRRARAIEPFDIAWLEEPMPADDRDGHAWLARQTPIPIAVGETLTTAEQCVAYMASGAASIMQVDAARVGGVTPWLKVAHAAEALNIAICPHFLMELHVSLVGATPAGAWVEHIPQLRAVTRSDVRVEAGLVHAPDAPGLGIDWDLERVAEFTVSPVLSA
ncbi:MAG TPA: mandelate racemase/muconate lactonizing enzyme family protein [Candidatus Ruania gallistercoris]|uniref:Mandelate racemase/muconate lactonizing enzyme family protein n=1 Tax=Candidatus Ruania gallistercoris TaxID=2838746 RepID=A0A9D2EFH4_9MICO|nr:mandelate racemase/muconate lactonizing enzyme family protein [Candidatus Ruania gallistercoris]